jgi:chromate transport protein ChrA
MAPPLWLGLALSSWLLWSRLDVDGSQWHRRRGITCIHFKNMRVEGQCRRQPSAMGRPTQLGPQGYFQALKSREQQHQLHRRDSNLLTTPYDATKTTIRTPQPTNNWNRAILTRGGGKGTPTSTRLLQLSSIILSLEDSKKLLDVIKAYWYMGFLGFGGTPTHVAIIKQQCQGWLSEEQFMDFLAMAHTIPGPTSTQLILATAASHAGMLGAILAGLLWTLPGFTVMILLAGRFSQPYQHYSLQQRYYNASSILRLLQSIPPVALALTLKSIIPMVASLDAMQRVVAICSCTVLSLLTNNNRSAGATGAAGGSSAAPFIVSTVLAMGAFLTFLEDYGSEQQPLTYTTTTTSTDSGSSGSLVPPNLQQTTGTVIVSASGSRTSANPGIGSTEEATVQRGFGGIPIIVADDDDDAGLPENILDLNAVAEKLKAVEAKFDQYFDEYFSDGMESFEEENFEQYFGAFDPLFLPLEQDWPIATGMYGGDDPTTSSSSLYTQNMESNRDENAIVRPPGDDGQPARSLIRDDRLNDTITSLRGVKNQTTALLQEARGGSSLLGAVVATARRQTRSVIPSIPGLRAVILWLTVLFITTFIQWDNGLYEIFAINYRLGSMLFSCGPGIVPLLAAKFVHTSISESSFFQGASICQFLPGSMFNFAAYVGAIQRGWKGAIAANVGIFAPGFILVFAALPLWSRHKQQPWFRSASRGLTAATVGLLCSACLSTYFSCITKGTDCMLFWGSACLAPFAKVRTLFVIALGALLTVFLPNMNLDQTDYQ